MRASLQDTKTASKSLRRKSRLAPVSNGNDQFDQLAWAAAQQPVNLNAPFYGLPEEFNSMEYGSYDSDVASSLEGTPFPSQMMSLSSGTSSVNVQKAGAADLLLTNVRKNLPRLKSLRMPGAISHEDSASRLSRLSNVSAFDAAMAEMSSTSASMSDSSWMDSDLTDSCGSNALMSTSLPGQYSSMKAGGATNTFLSMADMSNALPPTPTLKKASDSIGAMRASSNMAFHESFTNDISDSGAKSWSDSATGHKLMLSGSQGHSKSLRQPMAVRSPAKLHSDQSSGSSDTDYGAHVAFASQPSTPNGKPLLSGYNSPSKHGLKRTGLRSSPVTNGAE